MINIQMKGIMADSPIAGGIYFQDPGSNWMYAIRDLHDRIIYYMLIILLVVMVFQISAFKNKDHQANLQHGNKIELIWTIIPAGILWLIGLPSQKLLYIMDSLIYPEQTVKAIGSQWFWTYELTDYEEKPSIDSYLIPEAELEEGDQRNQAVDNNLVLPINTSIRVLVTSNDVIHSLAIPSLAIKLDAIPGRLNSTGVIINREATYYGQCSELCGIGHSAMPIGIIASTLDNYLVWLKSLD